MTDTGEDPLDIGPEDTAIDDDPTLAEPTAGEIQDAAAEVDETPAIGEELADRDAARQFDEVEPGAQGPEGTGVEGADDDLVDQSDDAGPIGDASGYASDASGDLQSAAEQGNRSGDEMTSADIDQAEATDLAGDDLDVDALSDDGVERTDTVDGLRVADGEPDER